MCSRRQLKTPEPGSDAWRPLKSLRSVNLDPEFDAKASHGLWYMATVDEFAGGVVDDPRSVFGRFVGWSRKFDEWFDDAPRVRTPRGVASALERAGSVHVSSVGAVVVVGEVQ